MYDFSRKSFIPNFSKSCLFPSDGDPHDDDDYWKKVYKRRDYQIAYFERIFICIGIVAFILGSIISIWTNSDSEFQNLHKPAPKENNNATGSFKNKSNRHEESIAKNDSK